MDDLEQSLTAAINAMDVALKALMGTLNNKAAPWPLQSEMALWTVPQLAIRLTRVSNEIEEVVRYLQAHKE